MQTWLVVVVSTQRVWFTIVFLLLQNLGLVTKYLRTNGLQTRHLRHRKRALVYSQQLTHTLSKGDTNTETNNSAQCLCVFGVLSWQWPSLSLHALGAFKLALQYFAREKAHRFCLRVPMDICLRLKFDFNCIQVYLKHTQTALSSLSFPQFIILCQCSQTVRSHAMCSHAVCSQMVCSLL